MGVDIANYALEKCRSREYERTHDLQYHDLMCDAEVVETIPLDVAEVYCPDEVAGQQEKLNLGLSTLRNSRNRPARHGQKGITSYGRRMVKSAATLLEQKYGKKRLTFATITLPPMDAVLRWYVHENWGEFVHRIMEEIKRVLIRKGVSSNIVAVTEVQEKRYAATGCVYLHLHCVWVGGSGKGRYYVTADQLRDILRRRLQAMARACSEEMGVPVGAEDICVKAAIDVQRVKKSVAAYLGKYLSKGVAVRDNVDDSERCRYFPRQWWTITAALRRAVLDSVVELSNEECADLMNDANIRQRCCIYAKEIWLNFGECKFLVGMVGCFRKTLRQHLSKTHPPSLAEV